MKTILSLTLALLVALPGCGSYTPSSSPGLRNGVQVIVLQDVIPNLTALRDSVVHVRVDDMMSGTGFVVKREKGSVTILTAWHVIRPAPEGKMGLISIVDRYSVSLLCTVGEKSEDSDAVLLHASFPEMDLGRPFLSQLNIAQGFQLVGDYVFAMGFPRDVPGVHVTVGRVLETRSGRWLVHDASMWFGNSGGPLFNSAGEVIGINQVVFFNRYFGKPGNEVGGSLRSDLLREFLEENK